MKEDESLPGKEKRKEVDFVAMIMDLQEKLGSLNREVEWVVGDVAKSIDRLLKELFEPVYSQGEVAAKTRYGAVYCSRSRDSIGLHFEISGIIYRSPNPAEEFADLLKQTDRFLDEFRKREEARLRELERIHEALKTVLVVLGE